MRPDLRSEMSESDRESPLVTTINGPLMARGCLNVAVIVKGELHDLLEKPSFIGGVGLPGRLAGAGRVPVAKGMRDLQVRQDCRAAIVTWDWVMVSYRGERMGPHQARINRGEAAVTGPAVSVANLLPELFACIVTRPFGSAGGADETAGVSVTMWAPVDLGVTCQTPHRLGEGSGPHAPEGKIIIRVRVIDGPLRDTVLATRPRIIGPRVHALSVRVPLGVWAEGMDARH
jgi:hypothetical protein